MGPLNRRAGTARTACGAVLAAASALLIACQTRPGTEVSPHVPDILAARCDTEPFHGLSDNRELVNVLVSWNDLRSMEVHDCQQLAADDVLGPLTAILVSTGRVALAQELPPGGVVVADILNYDDEAYPALHIEPGVNCLWIQGDPIADPAGHDWIAAVRQPNTGDCFTAVFDDAPAQTLELRRMRHGEDGRPGAYPSSGRWMWDHQNRSQFIGIRCGDAWCEIGSPDFASQTTLTDAHSVPGWHDEQLLSYLVDGSLRLSDLVGRLTAARGLAQLDVADFDGRDGNGRHVATMTFVGDDPAAFDAYVRKFKLDPQRTEHRIYLRVVPDPDGSPPAVVWQMRSDESGWTTAVRREHEHSGPGTVRWGWDPVDEGVWVSCPRGCCYSDEFGDRGVP